MKLKTGNPVKLTSVNHAEVNAFAKDLLEYIKPFAEARGVTVRLDGGKMEMRDFLVKYKFFLTGEAGTDAAKEEWDLYCHKFGLKPEWFGQTYTDFSGKRMKIVGIYPKKIKNPVRIEDVRTGKTFITQHRAVKLYMETKKDK